jgi:hypothetical protein
MSVSSIPHLRDVYPFVDEHEDNLFGDINMVNGVPWPVMSVKAKYHRFRVGAAACGSNICAGGDLHSRTELCNCHCYAVNTFTNIRLLSATGAQLLAITPLHHPGVQTAVRVCHCLLSLVGCSSARHVPTSLPMMPFAALMTWDTHWWRATAFMDQEDGPIRLRYES